MASLGRLGEKLGLVPDIQSIPLQNLLLTLWMSSYVILAESQRPTVVDRKDWTLYRTIEVKLP